MELATRWGRRLSLARTAAGKSVIDVAADTGLTRAAIYGLEAGKNLPSTASKVSLARALDTTVADLFPHEDIDQLAARP